MHVLGLPPAFVLSQDQTLRLNEIFIRHLYSRIDEVHTSPDPTPKSRTERQIVSSQRIRKTAEVSFTALVPRPKPEPQAPAKTSPSTLLFLQTRLSKNRPNRRETEGPPSRSILLSRPQQGEPVGPVDPIACREHQTARKHHPAAGGRGDIFTVIHPVNSRGRARTVFLNAAEIRRLLGALDTSP